jgi:hypothetical protein
MSALRHGAAAQALIGLLLLQASLTHAQTTAATPATLQSCAVINDPVARLACYDRLAGRPAAPVARAAASAAPAMPPPSAAPPAAALPATPETFGKYQAEHPQGPAVAPQLEAKVLSVGTSYSGHMTVTLEGGAVWELNESDPLLAAGDTVTITRASLGSYLMHTPQKRLHRARRLS